MEQLERFGFYGADYRLLGAEPVTLADLKNKLTNDPVRYTGWRPFGFLTTQDLAPQVVDENTYECVHDGSGRTGMIEQWRASTDGAFTIVRAHDLDNGEHIGRYINLILPVWRIAELLLHAGRMGLAFEAEEVDFTILFTGLENRELTSKETPGRFLAREYRTGAAEYEKAIKVPVDTVDRQVVEYTDKLLRPFYQMFEFDLPATLVEEEVGRMRSHRF